MNLGNDPIVKELRKKYLKRGDNPKPRQNLDDWAREYTDNLNTKLQSAGRMIHQKVPINDICKELGLRKETVESYYSNEIKRIYKKEREIDNEPQD